MRSALVAAVALTACYRPAHDIACTVSCHATAPCPGNLTCGGDQLCRAADQADCTSSGLDGGIADGQTCLGTLLQVHVCASPSQPVTLAGPFSTDNDCSFKQPQTGSKGPMLCVVAGTSVTIAGDLDVAGSLPLVLFATDQVEIGAGVTVDVASHRNVKTGPGANACSSASGQMGDANFGAGGGAGGTFQGVGGAGGNGAGLAAIKANGAPSSLPAPLSVVGGGCAGASGGGNALGNGAGNAGSGGGALYIVAGRLISAAGNINASGSSGGRATMSIAGGGGGGSGGLVVLDAPALAVTGKILANGAGGGGAASTSGAATMDGCEPDITKLVMPACGGAGGAPAGSGGTGPGMPSTTVMLDGSAGHDAMVDGTNVSGGGGGAGGAGHVLVSSPLLGGASIFPPPE